MAQHLECKFTDSINHLIPNAYERHFEFKECKNIVTKIDRQFLKMNRTFLSIHSFLGTFIRF